MTPKEFERRLARLDASAKKGAGFDCLSPEASDLLAKIAAAKGGGYVRGGDSESTACEEETPERIVAHAWADQMCRDLLDRLQRP